MHIYIHIGLYRTKFLFKSVLKDITQSLRVLSTVRLHDYPQRFNSYPKTCYSFIVIMRVRCLTIFMIVFNYTYFVTTETLPLHDKFTIQAMNFATAFMSQQTGYQFKFEQDYGTVVLASFTSKLHLPIPMTRTQFHYRHHCHYP